MDILVILRSFKGFTQRFRYNMFNQTFIEQLGDSQRLKAISITHISNSINTHGLGVINTSVDIVYKFVNQMVNVFSAMMQDQNLNSAIVREYRWFKKFRKKNIEENQSQKYPMGRGEKFYKEVKLQSTR